MQVWLFLFGAVACVVLSGATPVAEVKESSEELLEHHEIHKRQVVSAASDLSECHDRYTVRQAVCVCVLYSWFLQYVMLVFQFWRIKWKI